jgi:predicted  nucleic acid-binding Zn-ribbon protein
MIHPQIEKLLIVQTRDLALQKVQQEIERIPNDRTRIETLIDEEKASIESAKSDLNAKEVERNDLDSQIKAKESDIAKFKTQQLEVKKNDEYRALTHQIEQAQSDISQLEEQEIKIMYSIDEAKISFEQAKAEIDQRIVEQTNQLTELEARLKQLKENIQSAEADYLESRETVDHGALEIYDRTKQQTKRPPYISAIEVQNCAGCHLRVSNDVLGLAIAAEEIIACDQCARIVYKT